MRAHVISMLIVAISALCGSAAAAEWDTGRQKAVIDEVVSKVEDYYVYPEAGAAMIEKLREGAREGRYAVSDPGEFAERVSEDLKDASRDGHMYLSWRPAEYEALLQGPEEPDLSYWENLAKLRNEGFSRLDILPGNIRYVRWEGAFWNGARTEQTMADVARFMDGGAAVILDLRDNGGGAAEAVRGLVSYFLPSDHGLLLTFHDRTTGTSERADVVASLAGPRLVGKPLYVLIGPGAASAAEEFASHVKLFKLGALVGETTAGAANNNTLYPIAPGFVLSVSTGYPEHPVSGGNWEGVGVEPDMEVDAGKALSLARAAIYRELEKTQDENAREFYRVEQAVAEAEIQNTDYVPAHPGDYVGEYGNRAIWREKGALKYQRSGRGAVYTLKPVAADLFVFAENEDVRLLFRRENGRVNALSMFYPSGSKISAARTK